MKFRKKPVVIEAIQWDGSTESYVRIIENLNDTKVGDGKFMLWDDPEEGGVHIVISTLEGEMKAIPNDWIIKGIKGEFYPCKPNIFAETYEKAE